MKQIKIGYFADGVWAFNAFNLINSDSRFKIEFIVPRYNSTDETLENFAKQYNIDYIKTKNINGKDFLDEIEKYNCDVLVSMSFNQIFKDEILSRYKIINCHAGKLPFYRGRNVINWAIINDETEIGITAHFVDNGIDTGDIIIQKTFPITDDDDYASILSLAHEQCANILYEALIKYANNDIKAIKQETIHKVGMYCSARKEGDEIINWNSTSRDLFNFIRALCSPCVMAKTYLKGKPFFINKAAIVEDAPRYKGICGQVLYSKDNSIFVKTSDSILKLTEYFYDGKVIPSDRFSSVKD